MDLLKLIQDTTKSMTPGYTPPEATNGAALSLADIIAPSAIGVTPRELNMSGKIVRSFFVVSFPRYLNDGWLEPVLNLERVFDVSIFIHPLDTADVLKQGLELLGIETVEQM